MADRPAHPMGALEPSVRRDAWVLGVAVGVFGTSFGVLSTTAGLSVAQTCVMSLVVFTGASQFAVVGILASVAGGAVGPGRMQLVAPVASDVMVHAITTFGIGGLFGGLVMTWWQRRTARRADPASA